MRDFILFVLGVMVITYVTSLYTNVESKLGCYYEADLEYLGEAKLFHPHNRCFICHKDM